MINKKKKIGEDKRAIYYDDVFCKKYNDGYRVILGESKIKETTDYLLLNKDGEIVASSKSIEEIYWKKTVIDKTKGKELKPN